MSKIGQPIPTGDFLPGPVAAGVPKLAPAAPVQVKPTVQPPVAAPIDPFTQYWRSIANPWMQNVTATQNGKPQSWATPTSPNTNYVTPQAAQALASQMGANAVSQNLTNTASPGSAAPSSPMYGLDFGRGDVQDAGMGVFQAQRGDRPEDIAARYQAGLNNTGWGGPAPQINPANDMQWNRAAPLSRNTPTAEQKAFFAPQPQQNIAPVTGPAATNPAQSQGLLQLLDMLKAQGGGSAAGGLGGLFS